jgi:hypothetical protein
LRAKVVYRTVRQIGHTTILDDVNWDFIEIEDFDSVTMHAHGYLVVRGVENEVFLYPTVNVVKVEVV